MYVLDATYWRKIGEGEIANTLKAMEELNTNVAKNVIIFVGDGMSLPTVTAGRIYRAQQEARNAGKEEVNGEESFLTFEKFPHAGLSKVIIVSTIVLSKSNGQNYKDSLYKIRHISQFPVQ
jgi:alkaline phosphatase